MSHRPAAPGPLPGPGRGWRDRAGPAFAGCSYRIDQADDQGKLSLAATDDVDGNGSGAFTWLIQQYR